ncbi:MAG: MaoC family dehydratase N-terminal domain-containing protein [Chloroflexi bacterium]|nr:MaoC family dehydratase N-terminal domain-containing protein [Chloroflexota bacterium]
MAEKRQSLVTPELRQYIGKTFPLGKEAVEAGHIRRFADAIQDPNLLWRDPQFARKTRYRGVVAPPSFYHCLREVGYARVELPIPPQLKGGLNGGNEFEFFRPLRPGDVITGTAKIVDIFERQGRQWPMLFVVTEMTYTDQKGRLVAKQRSTGIRYPTS